MPEWRDLFSLGEELLKQTSISAQSLIVVESARRFFDCQVDIWLAENLIVPSPSRRKQGEMPEQGVLNPIMQIAWKGGQSEISQDSKAVAVPVKTDSGILAILYLERCDQPFSVQDQEFIRSLAVQVSIAFQSTYQRNIDLGKIESLELVRQVSSQFAKVLNIDDLSGQIAHLILDKFDYYYVAIFTFEPGEEFLCFRNSAGPNPSLQEKPAVKRSTASESSSTRQPTRLLVAVGKGIIGSTAKAGIPILENDVSSSETFRYTDSLPGTKAEFAIPLKAGDQVIGVLDIQSDQVNAFGEIDSLILTALADNIAAALSNADLYWGLQQQTEQIASVAEISKAITSILDIDNLFNNVVSVIHKRFNYPEVNIYTVTTAIQKIQFRAGVGSAASQLGSGEFTYDDDQQLGQVAREAQTVIIDDAESIARIHGGRHYSEDTRSILLVPLIFGSDVVGILEVQTDKYDGFGLETVTLFQSLGGSIAVAIRNANLYRSEQWRRQVADSMQQVVGLLSSNVAVNEVLDQILIELEKNLSYDASTIWLLGDSEADTGLGQFISPLRLVALRMKPDMYSQVGSGNEEARSQLDEVLENYELPPAESPWIREALESLQPIIRREDSPYEPIGALLAFPSTYSCIAAPLRIGERILGVLILADKSSGKYGSEAQVMTAAYAGYAAVAIENTRLYEAAHDQAWISTILLQVAEATRSLTSINELLETVVRIVPKLAGVASCAAILWDKAIDQFTSIASSGLTSEREKDFMGWNFRIGDVPDFDKLLQDKAPVILDFTSIPSQVIDEYFSSFDKEMESLVLFPLVVQQEVLGALLINLASLNPETADVNEFGEDKVAIIQGIAYQTAIALDNIQLLEAQEDEGYVNVALLQVAQAVVSSNELEDILESIVRITPILVGVRTCFLYLWDGDKKIFRLSQSFGVARSELQSLAQTCTPAEFPLLAAIHQKNQIGLHFIPGAVEHPSSWQQINENDFFTISSNLDEDESSENPLSYRILLQVRQRLLMGFPLAVKGSVLGVMLTEEEASAKGLPSYHIREKRLEIVTGITQQAALAIENDLLQAKAVERERLERELQLAREIQVTFLPDHVPAYPGWEIDIRWRPARQVSGDFYDIIELPGNRLGIVIADVADKGVPAALFMTLIRTLIRAEVRDETSPAAILNRVNDLLVPDSKRGMFVTVVFAVLNVDDGRLVYANAGHNPPLLSISDSDRLVELTRTGMALGIFEGIQLAEREIHLDAGDTLVFYTDGITEAATLDGDFYGIERLNEAVRADNTSARDILDKIEESVSTFTGEAPRSDDLTLIALLRQRT